MIDRVAKTFVDWVGKVRNKPKETFTCAMCGIEHSRKRTGFYIHDVFSDDSYDQERVCKECFKKRLRCAQEPGT